MLEPKTIELDGVRYQLTPIPVLRAARLDKKVLTLLAPVMGPMLAGDLNAEVDLQKVAASVSEALTRLSDDDFTALLRDLMSSVTHLPEGAAPEALADEAALNRAFTGNLGGMYRLSVEVMRFNRFSFFANLKGGGAMLKMASSPEQRQG